MLKKENLQWKGYNLPIVYAKAEVNTHNQSATFYLGASREKIDNGEWIDKIENVSFEWDRLQDPVVCAYNQAKGSKTIEYKDEQTQEIQTITIYGVLYGWVDDYS